MRKSLLASATLALAAVLAPSIGHADSTTYTPAWANVHQGGDSFNLRSSDKNTGAAQILRINVGAPSGGLGCTATGGYIEFEHPVTIDAPGAEVTVSYTDALLTPYAFVKAAIRQNGEGVNAIVVRGPLQGSGDLTMKAERADGTPVTGTVDLWFGLEMSSSCLLSPEVARATFPQVTVTTP